MKTLLLTVAALLLVACSNDNDFETKYPEPTKQLLLKNKDIDVNMLFSIFKSDVRFKKVDTEMLYQYLLTPGFDTVTITHPYDNIHKEQLYMDIRYSSVFLTAEIVKIHRPATHDKHYDCVDCFVVGKDSTIIWNYLDRVGSKHYNNNDIYFIK